MLMLTRGGASVKGAWLGRTGYRSVPVLKPGLISFREFDPFGPLYAGGVFIG